MTTFCVRYQWHGETLVAFPAFPAEATDKVAANRLSNALRQQGFPTAHVEVWHD